METAILVQANANFTRVATRAIPPQHGQIRHCSILTLDHCRKYCSTWQCHGKPERYNQYTSRAVFPLVACKHQGGPSRFVNSTNPVSQRCMGEFTSKPPRGAMFILGAFIVRHLTLTKYTSQSLCTPDIQGTIRVIAARVMRASI